MAKLGFKSSSLTSQPIHLPTKLFHYSCICPPPGPPSCSMPAQYPLLWGNVPPWALPPALQGWPRDPNLASSCTLPPGKLGCRFDFHAQDPLPLLIIVSRFLWGNTQALHRNGLHGDDSPHPHLQGETCDSGLATQAPKRPDWFRKLHMTETRPTEPMPGFY